MNVTIRPVYDCHRRSRFQLWGVHVDGVCIVVTRRYPSWITKE